MKFLKASELPVFEFTPSGFEELKEKLGKVESQRPEAVDDLAKARAMGDLSENGYYKAARAKLSSIDSQIKQLRFQIKYAKVIQKRASVSIGFGSTIEVEVNGLSKTFTIVGKQESNPMEGKLSAHSPIGKALMNHQAGDIVEIRAPSGIVTYTVLVVR